MRTHVMGYKRMSWRATLPADFYWRFCVITVLYCFALAMALLSIALASLSVFHLIPFLHIAVLVCGVAVVVTVARVCYGALVKRFTSATGVG